MRNIVFIIVFLGITSNAKSQKPVDSLAGKWLAAEWQADGRKLVFGDTIAAMNFLVEQVKESQNLTSVTITDSVQFRAEALDILKSMEEMRFRLHLNVNRTFTYTPFSKEQKTVNGTYLLKENKELVLTSKDEVNPETKKPLTLTIIVVSVLKDKLLIRFVNSRDPAFSKTTWTLKREL